MTLRELLIQELDNVSDPLIVEVIDFLQILKTRQKKDHLALDQVSADLAFTSLQGDSQVANYRLQGERYRYDDPFSPAIPLEEWEILKS